MVGSIIVLPASVLRARFVYKKLDWILSVFPDSLTRYRENKLCCEVEDVVFKSCLQIVIQCWSHVAIQLTVHFSIA